MKVLCAMVIQRSIHLSVHKLIDMELLCCRSFLFLFLLAFSFSPALTTYGPFLPHSIVYLNLQEIKKKARHQVLDYVKLGFDSGISQSGCNINMYLSSNSIPTLDLSTAYVGPRFTSFNLIQANSPSAPQLHQYLGLELPKD